MAVTSQKTKDAIDQPADFFEYFFPDPVDAHARGGLILAFDSLLDVDNWMEAYGDDGPVTLRAALKFDAVKDEKSRGMAQLWLEVEDRRLDELRKEAEIKQATRAADAAARAANWSKWAAIAAGAGAVITAAAALWNAITPPPVPQVLLLPANLNSAAPTVALPPTHLEIAPALNPHQSSLQLQPAPRSSSEPAAPDRTVRPAPIAH
ncbi:hypothetical protein [Xylophilus sp. Leaf220]|uniref:hypothetical protein n=1 Tax=Xylophilus sp. Leaf220 TaxID=1735686 RepID=UPI0012E10290|nr:hypothetical protein [Xylophilus sp. Leaf220]